MSNRALAITAALLFMVIAVAVTAVGPPAVDAGLPTPPSTYLVTPGGASGLAETLERLGVRVERWRRTYRALEDSSIAENTLLAVLDPENGISASEAGIIVAFARYHGPVLIAGPRANAALACWGFASIRRAGDSIHVRTPEHPATAGAPWVQWVLGPEEVDTIVSRETRYAGVIKEDCHQHPLRVDTLLVTVGRRPVLVRMVPKEGWPALILSDPALLSNRSLREHDLGPQLVSLLMTSPAVRFDEYHHGHDDGAGILAVVAEWSSRSPWGWMAWQLAVIGLIALLVSMLRTGPIVAGIERKRRSPLEHVRALATALRAARGHDVAVDLLVRGLRRRLSHDGRASRVSVAHWLVQLQDRVRTPRARAAAVRLGTLTRPGRSADDVLAAANAVEEVWQEFRP